MIGDESTTSAVGLVEPGAPDEDGVGALAPAPGGGLGGERRAGRAGSRTRRRRWRAACARRPATGAWRRRGRPSGSRSSTVFSTRHGDVQQGTGPVGPPGVEGDHAADRVPVPRGPPDHDPGVVGDRFGVGCRRRRGARAMAWASAIGQQGDGVEVDLVLLGLGEGDVGDVADREGLDRARTPSAVAASIRRSCTCRKRIRTRSTGDGARVDEDLGAVGRPLRTRRRRPAPAAPARRTASGSGSSAPTPGRGTARSPRRARRRPPTRAAAKRSTVGRLHSMPASLNRRSMRVVPARSRPAAP